MSAHESPVQRGKESYISWISKPENATLVGILIFAFALRLYFLLQTKTQALWWDEAEYLSAAKHWATGLPYVLNPQRPPLFQFISSLALRAGVSEVAIKFLFVLIPSVALVFAVYLLGKQMFSTKVGLIGAFLTSVSWTLLFWTPRVQPDFFSMTFQVLSIYFMWRHWHEAPKNSRLILWAGFFAALGFYFKISGLLIPMSFAVYIAVKEQFKGFTNKYNYYFALAFLVTMIPFFIWSNSAFHDPVAIFHSGYSSGIQPEAKTPLGWYNLQFLGSLSTSGVKSGDVISMIFSDPATLLGNFYQYILFLTFFVGCVLFLKFVLYFDVVMKKKESTFDGELMSIIVIVVTAAFYIFYIRGTEDRWVFLWLPFMYFIIGQTVLALFGWGKKYGVALASLVVLAILITGAIGQVAYANSLIVNKETSYLPVKAGGLWMKDNSLPGDKILTISYPQTVYYSERNVTIFSDIGIENATAMDAYVNGTHPKYIEISRFEPHPAYTNEWLQMNQYRLTVAQAYFADEARTQPMLVIYEVHY